MTPKLVIIFIFVLKMSLDVLARKCEGLHSFVAKMDAQDDIKVKIFYSEMFKLKLKVRDGRVFGATTVVIDELYQKYQILENIALRDLT